MLDHYRIISDDPKNTGAVFLPVSPSLEQIVRAMRAEGIVHINEKTGTFRMLPTHESGPAIVINKMVGDKIARSFRLVRVD